MGIVGNTTRLDYEWYVGPYFCDVASFSKFNFIRVIRLNDFQGADILKC